LKGDVSFGSCRPGIAATRATRKSIKELVRTAHDSTDEYDLEGILKALEEMK